VLCNLGPRCVPFSDHQLQVVVRLGALELSDARLQALNRAFRPLPNGTLGLAVILALPRELLRGEV
jgi:hypothetical protein